MRRRDCRLRHNHWFHALGQQTVDQGRLRTSIIGVDIPVLLSSIGKLVAQCRNAGAIIIVKTNVPQTMFAFECSNALWGRTTNPWGDKFTCGGSSGGGLRFVLWIWRADDELIWHAYIQRLRC